MSRFEKQLLFFTAALALASSACVEPPSGSSQGTSDLGVDEMGMVPDDAEMASPEEDMADPVEEDMEVTEDMELDMAEDMAGVIASVRILSPADGFELESSERATFSLELEVRDANGDVIVDGYTPTVTVKDETVATLEGPSSGEYTLIGATPGATELVVTVGEQRASLGIQVDPQMLDSIRFEQGVYRYFFRGGGSFEEAKVIALSEKGLPIEPFPESACTLTYVVGDDRILDNANNRPLVEAKFPGVTFWNASCQEIPELEDTAMVLVEYPQQIDTLDAHSCMRTDDEGGVMRCWGRNDHGQIGDGSLIDALEPTVVPFFDEMGIATQHIAVGANHTCMISSEGELYCWGDNRSGQVAPSSVQTTIKDPARIAPERRFVSVSAGDTHTCAITIDGELLCWGTGSQGQLGLGLMEKANEPTRVSEFRFFRVDAGPTHTCAVSFDKRLFCWGDDSFGKLGNGAAEGTGQPDEIAVESSDGAGNVRFEHVIVGEVATCAIPAFTTGGAPSELYCWGRGELFENGLVDPNNMMSFEPRTSPEVVSWPSFGTASPDSLKSASLGSRHGCVLAADSLYCWGLGDYGQLGRGDFTSGSIDGNNEIATPRPALLLDMAGEPGVLTTVKFRAVAAGELHTCALADNDSLACWGYAGNGRLGNGETGIEPFDGDSPSYSLPVNDVAVGREHLCALSAQNAFCFGNNFYQQAFEMNPPRRLLGPGSVDGESEAGTIPPLKNIEAGERFTIGILLSDTDRRLYGWGANEKDQVDSSANTRNLPGARNPVAKLTRALAPITAGYDHVCSVLDVNNPTDPDETALVCWGDDEHGQLGSLASQNGAFVEVTELPSDFELTLLDAGDDITCAAGHLVDAMLMPTESRVYCWGKGVGRWGVADPDTDARLPKLIKTYPLQQDVMQLSVGGGHACTLLKTGTLECWGRNDFHQATSSDEPFLAEPTEVTPPTDRVFTDITTGHQHTCALAELPGDIALVPEKYVYCWGDNRLGQSGLEGNALDGNHVRAEPYLLEPMRPPQELTRTWQPRRIVAGWATTCALIQENFPNDGENYKVHCWGNNSHGQAHQRKDSETDRKPQLELYPAPVWSPAMP